MENNPKKVVLHCAATPDYPDDAKKYDLFGAADIDAWHRQRGWREIGYHYVIRRTGVIEIGDRDLSEYGAHVQGHNKDSIGVCYIGTAKPTKEQVESILSVFGIIYDKFGITPEQWFGHYEFTDKKACPGISMNVIRELLRSEMKSSTLRKPTINIVKRD